MQELVEIRNRLKTVDTIHSVASTLATVSAAKLSRARERALASRVYTEAVRGLVSRQLEVARAEGLDAETLSTLFAGREVHRQSGHPPRLLRRRGGGHRTLFGRRQHVVKCILPFRLVLKVT